MSTDQQIDVAAQYSLQRDGRVVGVVQVAADEQRSVVAALEGTGLQVAEVEMEEEEEDGAEYVLGQDCTEARPRACELDTAIGMALAIARDAGVHSEALEALEHRAGERLPIRESDVRAAIVGLRAELPPAYAAAVDALLDVAFGT